MLLFFHHVVFLPIDHTGQYWSDDLHQPKVFEHMEVTTLSFEEHLTDELTVRKLLIKSNSLYFTL